jgi:hypothetical protein
MIEKRKPRKANCEVDCFFTCEFPRDRPFYLSALKRSRLVWISRISSSTRVMISFSAVSGEAADLGEALVWE